MSGLQGRVAGMNVTTDGKPGGGNTDTKLRGITTINNSSPLYVIDAVSYTHLVPKKQNKFRNHKEEYVPETHWTTDRNREYSVF